MVLVDANVLLDIITADPVWFDWSAKALEKALGKGLAINPVIYAEVGAGFRKETELEAAMDWAGLSRLSLPCEAAFRAGQAVRAIPPPGRRPQFAPAGLLHRCPRGSGGHDPADTRCHPLPELFPEGETDLSWFPLMMIRMMRSCERTMGLEME